MAVKIRLKRIGRRNRPFYRMCVFDSRTRRDGQPVEELGSYDPRAATLQDKTRLKLDRAWYWLSVGAQPSDTCRSILSRLGVRKGGPEPSEEMVAAAWAIADQGPGSGLAVKPAADPAPVAVAAEEPAAAAEPSAEAPADGETSGDS